MLSHLVSGFIMLSECSHWIYAWFMVCYKGMGGGRGFQTVFCNHSLMSDHAMSHGNVHTGHVAIMMLKWDFRLSFDIWLSWCHNGISHLQTILLGYHGVLHSGISEYFMPSRSHVWLHIAQWECWPSTSGYHAAVQRDVWEFKIASAITISCPTSHCPLGMFRKNIWLPWCVTKWFQGISD